jgi:hypothetical protein
MEIPEDRAERIALLAVSGPVIGFGIRLGRPKSERPMNLLGRSRSGMTTELTMLRLVQSSCFFGLLSKHRPLFPMC